MNTIFYSIIIFISVCIVVWISGSIIAYDNTIPTEAVNRYKNVLFIYPHPDDEVLNSGGLIHALAKQGSITTLVLLTKGEKGTPDASVNTGLKKIRTHEAQQSQKILGITTLIQEDFGDGELEYKRDSIRNYIHTTIAKIKPDLIITYDRSGLYGHPDHVVVSELVTEITANTIHITPLWYVSFPERILSMIKLPEHMAKDPLFREKRATANLKINVTRHIIPKIHTVYAYKSQYRSFRDGMPEKFIPLWFYYSMPQYEYFSKVQ